MGVRINQRKMTWVVDIRLIVPGGAQAMVGSNWGNWGNFTEKAPD